jgi:hypothetical protein
MNAQERGTTAASLRRNAANRSTSKNDFTWGVESQTFHFKIKTRKCSQLHSLRCMKKAGYKQLENDSIYLFDMAETRAIARSLLFSSHR